MGKTETRTGIDGGQGLGPSLDGRRQRDGTRVFAQARRALEEFVKLLRVAYPAVYSVQIGQHLVVQIPEEPRPELIEYRLLAAADGKPKGARREAIDGHRGFPLPS